MNYVSEMYVLDYRLAYSLRSSSLFTNWAEDAIANERGRTSFSPEISQTRPTDMWAWFVFNGGLRLNESDLLILGAGLRIN